jgi:hypothetical protein
MCYGNLPLAEQDAAIASPQGRRKIVLATSIAETVSPSKGACRHRQRLVAPAAIRCVPA